MNVMTSPTLQANDTVEIELTAAQWNTVMVIMAEAPMPHRIVDPLIRAIQQQCMTKEHA